MLVNLRLPSYKHLWPVDPNSATPPGNWKGWPGGKKFALVLTHDVETEVGHDKSMQLAELEENAGFRSSFNFVAEDFNISMELIELLASRGFEVGIHSLHHKNPFKSRKSFRTLAAKVNSYLKDWNAVGFRSPSMYHNLNWMHDLDIEYDASTFDTDPFEPQSDGAGTIFPFWVSSGNNGTGYVELPYTLPQDFLLYILMREKNISIWKRKLDWIAQKGGMALFITHPDYMNFDNRKGYDKYPSHLYQEFLNYIKSKYDGQYWLALPKDMARFWSTNYKFRKEQTVEPKHICMLAYSFYESDNRILRYADALAKRGDTVDVIALQRENTDKYENINGVNVYRIQKRTVNEKFKISYLSKLITFLVKSSMFVSKKHVQHPYDMIHVHSVPDFEVFAALLPKLKGSKIILDIHDIVPEFYASKFLEGTGSLLFKFLVKLEQWSSAFADHVIISNHIWYQKLIGRSVKKQKCTTIMNYPDEDIFYQRPRKRGDGKFIMIYPGTLGWHQGLDIAIKAFASIRDKIPHAELHLYGRGTERPGLEDLARKLRLENKVLFRESLPITKIADVMSNADIGVVPKRNDPFGGEAFSTKILEFMMLGIPVIVSRTKIDNHYFNDSVVNFFEPDNEKDLARAMLTLALDSELRNTLRHNALNFVEEFKWSRRKNEYFRIVDSLLSEKVIPLPSAQDDSFVYREAA